MVEYLSSLRTQQQDSNATYIHEAKSEFVRSLREKARWFPDDSSLHAPTKLDQLACDLATGRLKLRILFLTGDAGDGKTAFCAQLARELQYADELMPETSIGGFIVIKDASELDECRLCERILCQMTSEPACTLVVAINEGRLRRVFRALRETVAYPLWSHIVEPALESWANRDRVEQIDTAMREWRVMVINFRYRFHVRTVAPALLQRWTDQAQWEGSPACSLCPKQTNCPILANATDMRRPQVQQVVSDVLAWSHFSGQRLPFRRLQAVVAIAITGGLVCQDLLTGAVQHESPLRLLSYRYYHALFFRAEVRNPVHIVPEPVALTFTGADPSRLVDPEGDERINRRLGLTVERDSINRATGDKATLEARAIEELNALLDPSAGFDGATVRGQLATAVRLFRQLSLFEDSGTHRPTWRRALELLETYALGDDSESRLQRTVVEALNRLHRVEELKRDTIAATQIDPAGLRIPSRQVLELNLGTDFRVSVECGPLMPAFIQPYVETIPSEIHLKAMPSGSKGTSNALLHLDARLVNILLGVLEGYTAWQALGPFRRDLARFHGRLMALAIAEGCKPAVTIRVGEHRYGVATEEHGGLSRLRFEGQG